MKRIEPVIHGLTIVMLLVASSVAAAQEFTASLSWARRAELAAPVSGVISEVSAVVGQRVNKGAVLVQLDPRPFQAQIDQVRAQLDGMRELRAEAEREQERAIELYERTVLSDHELQVAKIEFARADADYRQAQARLRQLELELAYSSVRAPFDALVIERTAEVGQAVSAELEPRALVTVAQAGVMRARASVDAEQVRQLAPGDRATVDVAGKAYAAELKWIGLEPSQAQPLRYPVEFELTTGSDPLRAGLPATVRLP
jgi:RND family efflux transporter MFP subunit